MLITIILWGNAYNIYRKICIYGVNDVPFLCEKLRLLLRERGTFVFSGKTTFNLVVFQGFPIPIIEKKQHFNNIVCTHLEITFIETVISKI